jgi:hypothetical protein
LREKKTRNSSPLHSRAEKEHTKAIVDQTLKAIAKLQSRSPLPIYQTLAETLSNGQLLYKTKFVLLCIMLSRRQCLADLGRAVDHILTKKTNRLMEKQKNNKEKLENGVASIKYHQELKASVERACQHSPLTRIQI